MSDFVGYYRIRSSDNDGELVCVVAIMDDEGTTSVMYQIEMQLEADEGEGNWIRHYGDKLEGFSSILERKPVDNEPEEGWRIAWNANRPVHLFTQSPPKGNNG